MCSNQFFRCFFLLQSASDDGIEKTLDTAWLLEPLWLTPAKRTFGGCCDVIQKWLLKNCDPIFSNNVNSILNINSELYCNYSWYKTMHRYLYCLIPDSLMDLMKMWLFFIAFWIYFSFSHPSWRDFLPPILIVRFFGDVSFSLMYEEFCVEICVETWVKAF